MVLLSGCHPQDCHYITGQQVAAKRFEAIAKRLQSMGISPDGFRVEWISAAEGAKYARVMREMHATRLQLGTDYIKAENAKVKPELEKRLRRLPEIPEVAEALARARAK